MSVMTASGWWKAPIRFLPWGELMPVLPPTEESTWDEQRRRNLDEVHPAPQDRRGKARKIADDAAAEGDDAVAPLDPRHQQPVAEFGQVLVALGRLARRHDDGGGADAARGKRALQRCEMCRRHVLVRHDGGHRPLHEGGHDVARAGQKPLADVDVIAAVAQRHGHGFAPFWRLSCQSFVFMSQPSHCARARITSFTIWPCCTSRLSTVTSASA